MRPGRKPRPIFLPGFPAISRLCGAWRTGTGQMKGVNVWTTSFHEVMDLFVTLNIDGFELFVVDMGDLKVW